jgi:hypothetical protein
MNDKRLTLSWTVTKDLYDFTRQWAPYGNWLYKKFHRWAWKYGGRNWHDRLLSSWWYRTWYKCGRYVHDENELIKLITKEFRNEIDQLILEELRQNNGE